MALNHFAVAEQIRTKPCVVIADDHAPIRERLRRVVANRLEVVAEASNGEEVVEAVERHNPELLLLDVSMPRRNGFEVLQWMREKHPEVRVVMVTEHSEPFYLQQAFARGAHGFLLKRSIPSSLNECITTVLGGERYGFSASKYLAR